MIANTTHEMFLKEDSQTLTEASSQLTTDNTSISECKQDTMLEDQAKKEQNKIKYRKLKQKLSNMGFNHDDKCVVNKDFSSPKKQRIMKLALDFEKMIKIQNRDYQALEIIAREIYKIVQIKNELDLQLLRQSRFIPALFELLQKVPSLHKAQFNNLLRGMQICFRIMHIFAIMAVNREYLILTNRLNGLVSFTSWILARDDKKATISKSQLNIYCLSFKLINLLLLDKSKKQDIVPIMNTTVQLIYCSQIFKKIKIVLTEQFYQDEMLQETQTIQQILKFIFHVIRRSHTKLEPIVPLVRNHQQTSNQTQLSFENKLISNPLSKLIQYLIPLFMGYFNQLQQTQQPTDTQSIPQSYPIIVQSIMGFVIKLINTCFEVSFFTAKKFVAEVSKQNSLFSLFLDKIRLIIMYCKRQMEQCNNNTLSNNLLNQIIIMLGHIALDDQCIQRKIYDNLILQEVFDLPLPYIMDSYLRDISIPTFCSLIFNNKVNLNLLLKDNSPQPIIKNLKKQMMSRPSLTKKASTSSLMSYAIVSHEYNSPNYQIQRLALQMRFPALYWESLCIQLQKHV